MSQDGRRHEIAMKRVVFQLPGMDAVTIRRDEVYRATDGEALTMDLYHPPDGKSGEWPPVVIFPIGYPDAGAQRLLGCKAKEMESFISWARLVAASGMAAVTHTTGDDPAVDVTALIQHVRRNARALGIDENRIGLWACSGHVPSALSVLMRDRLKCAALFYGYMLDLDGSTAVAEAARTFRFVNASAGRSVADLPPDTPLFIARAGRDEMPRLNESLDRFVAGALACNLPVTLVNHPSALHAFDLMHDRETSREIIRQALAFLRFHLSA